MRRHPFGPYFGGGLSTHPPKNTRTQCPITKKRKQWTSSENREVLICYFKPEPSQRGYRKRFHALWIEHHPESDISEQRLADEQKTHHTHFQKQKQMKSKDMLTVEM